MTTITQNQRRAFDALSVVRKLTGTPVTALVGSILITGRGKDIDIMCWHPTAEHPPEVFEPDLDMSYDDALFSSFRYGHINLLWCNSLDYFLTELAAAYGASIVFDNPDLDMTERENRVLFHSQIREEVNYYRKVAAHFELFGVRPV